MGRTNPALCHSLLSLLSVIVSTLKGVEYVLTNGPQVLHTVLQLLPEQQQDGSVNQRFCVAILQKISIKEDTITVFLDKKAHGCDIVQWILSLIERSVKSDIHIFSLDFSSALLANILHAQSTITTLAPSTVTGILNRILGMLQVPHPQQPTSVLMHLLICLSYLKRDRFQ